MQTTPDLSPGAVCGGVIGETFFREMCEIDPYRYMMCLVLPDRQFVKYRHLMEYGGEKGKREAKKIVEKHAWSQV
ncbi:MAG: hypothetical protein KGI03_00825 [Patescibacteria group bacterium]|nr:hypothetical protein [Patescibacteria group bacterium]